jgi:hypothetical protein
LLQQVLGLSRLQRRSVSAATPTDARRGLGHLAELGPDELEDCRSAGAVCLPHAGAPRDDQLVSGARAVVRDETDEQAYILTLVENLQGEDLSPKEEAAALEVLVRERGWSTRQVGEAIKRSAIHVSRRLRVFDDPGAGLARAAR